MAMAWRRLLTLPALPPAPLLSSPCLNSCMTRPMVLRCRDDGLGMATSAVLLGVSPPTSQSSRGSKRRIRPLARLRPFPLHFRDGSFFEFGGIHLHGING